MSTRRQVHSGIGGHPRGKGVPARLWQLALEAQFVPRLPSSRNDLLVLLTRTTKRKVHHYGIEFENLLYQNSALAPLRGKLARAKHYRTTRSDIEEAKASDIKEGIVQIKYHPGDLSRIWVLDPFSDQYLEVLAVDQQYTQDLSLWKHLVIKRAVHEELGRQVNPEALVLAKARLQQLITDDMRLTRKIRSRQTMARWWNEQVTTWMTDSNAPASVPSGSSPYPPTLTAEHTDRKNKSQSEPLEASLLLASASDTIPPHEDTSSDADLSEPLPALDAQVKLLSDLPSSQTATPFASFPPLPPKKNTPPKTQRSNSRKTQPQTNPSTLEQANQPPSPQQAKEQDHPSTHVMRNEMRVSSI